MATGDHSETTVLHNSRLRIIATARDPSQRALGGVVVERHACVVEKTAEFSPLVQGVGELDAAAGRYQYQVEWLERMISGDRFRAGTHAGSGSVVNRQANVKCRALA